MDAATSDVSQLVASANGKWLAAASRQEKKVLLWDLQQRKLAHRFDTGGLVHSISLSPDSKLLAAASWDGSAKVWNIESHELVKELGGYGRVHRVLFSPDGQTLAVSETPSGQTDLYDTITWQKRTSFQNGYGVGQMAFSPDGESIATGGNGLKGSEPWKMWVRVWNAATGEKLMEFKEMQNAVSAVTFSPDSRYLIAIGGNWGSNPKWGGEAHQADAIRIWDLTTKKLVAEFNGHDGWVRDVAFAPDGKHFATAGMREVKVWGLAAVVGDSRGDSSISPQPPQQLVLERRLMGHTGPISRPMVFLDNRRVISGGKYELLLWDVETGRSLRDFTTDGFAPVMGLGVSPDRQQLVTAHMDNHVRLWDIESGKLLVTKQFEVPAYLRETKFLEDGKRLFVINGKHGVLLLGAQTLQELSRFDVPRAHCAALLPDGRHFVVGCFEGDAALFDLETGEKVRDFESSDGSVLSVAVSPDGTLVAVGKEQDGLLVWETATGRRVGNFQSEKTVQTVAFTPDGRHIVGGALDKSLRVWNVLTNHEVASVVAADQVTWKLAVAPDGRHVLSGGGSYWDEGVSKAVATGDNALRLWRLPESVWSKSTSDESTDVRRFEGHTDMIDAVAFTPDGQRIVTGGFDEAVRVWEVATGKLLDTIHTPHAVLCLAVSPDGKTVVAGMFGTQVVLWDLKSKRDVHHFIGHEQGNWRGGNAGRVLAVAFSPDGTKLASGGEGPMLRVWNVATGKQLAEFPSNGTPIQSIGWTSHGQQIVFGEYNGTMIWCNVATKQVERRSDGKGYGRWLALSPDDRRLVGGENIYDVATWELVKRLNVGGTNLISPQFTSDGRFVVASATAGLVRVWDAETGEEVARFEDALGQATKLAISSDGRNVAFGGGATWSDEQNRLIKTGDYALRVWQLPLLTTTEPH